MDLMARRRELLNQKKYIRVLWNNFEPPFSTTLYRPYLSSNTALEDVENGVVKQRWLTSTGNNGGFAYTTRIIDINYTLVQGHIMYLSYCILCSQSGVQFSVEYAGGIIPDATTPPVNTWTRLSFCDAANRTGPYPVYYANRRGGTAANATNGTYVLLKSPLFVDLTLMFGAGNEPDKETFERQCAMNGINLTESHEQDISGTQRWWIV